MNASVAAYAPKNKTYGFTDSINARVAIAAAVQIVGYLFYTVPNCAELL